jgi:hypothetical protein
MSKKLIAVAAAAALAITGLVAAPASASGSIAYSLGGTPNTSGLTAAAPISIPVPAANALTAANNLKIAVTGLTATGGDTVTVTTTGSVRVISDATIAASNSVDVTKLGTTSATTTPTGATHDFYVYTTSTGVGSFTVNTKSKTATKTETRYLKGTSAASNAHTISGLSTPSALADGAEGTVSFKVLDVFGNAIEDFDALGATVVTEDAAGNKATFAKAAGTDDKAFDSSSKSYKLTITSDSDNAMILNVDLDATTAPVAFPKVKDTAAVVINFAGSSEVAKLQALVDRKVSKKRFNTLAKKWNAAFPSQAVKLKK